MKTPFVGVDESLHLRNGVVIPRDALTVRCTTSSGPGGQHANRTMSKVVVSVVVAEIPIAPRWIELLGRQLGERVSCSSSTHRSQAANRRAALERLAEKLHQGLYEDPIRRPTKPTRGSQQRRVQGKMQRAAVKQSRRRPLAED